MIQISAAQKGPPPAKLVETAKQAAAWLLEYNQFASTGLSATQIAKNQEEYLAKLEISSKSYAPNEVKAQLVACHYGKCAYCETRIIHSHYGDVEHFRPKKGVTFFDKTGKMATIADAYFWRAFDWNNLFLSCGVCNEQYKKNYFGLLPSLTATAAEQQYLGVGPLKVPTVAEKRQSPANPNLLEQAILIDPGVDEPRVLIRFDVRNGQAMPSPTINLLQGDKALAYGRTAKTIEVLGLNRPALVEARARHLLSLHLLLIPILGDLPALQQFVQFGALCFKQKDTLVPRSDPLANLLAQAATAAGSNKASKEAVLAFGRLVASIQPWAEYTALALDAVVTWSIQEFARVSATQTLQATTQASGGSANIGATHSLAPRLPASLSTTLEGQTQDYRQIVAHYCKDRWTVGTEEKADQSAMRVALHGELNTLIEDYEAAWKEVHHRAKAFKTQEAVMRHGFLKEEVENYQEQFARGIEDASEEPLLLACLQKVTESLTPLFKELLASTDLATALKLVTQGSKLLRVDIPAFYALCIKDADTKKAHSDPMAHWLKMHSFFVERVDHTLGKAHISTFVKDFMEGAHDNFVELYNRFTDVVVRYRLNSLYNKTVETRANPLKQAIQAMIQHVRDHVAGKPTPTHAPLVAISLIRIVG
ncbi:hypothetical protein HUA78_35815 [Myxococcus sp. CA033]|uniref:hypothetical protein n=1 Tax=Myxococcus sp. CA033 TaxID=2741516 RepID=UPI00157B0D3B|nr:hypothetical protein [Myxococcus sp. CA033]NTX39818.1 hypothetical protein [Myxococcus sp. CA033]